MVNDVLEKNCNCGEALLSMSGYRDKTWISSLYVTRFFYYYFKKYEIFILCKCLIELVKKSLFIVFHICSIHTFIDTNFLLAVRENDIWFTKLMHSLLKHILSIEEWHIFLWKKWTCSVGIWILLSYISGEKWYYKVMLLNIVFSTYY